MKTGFYRAVQVVLFTAVTALPVVLGDRFASHDWRFIAVFLSLAISLGVVEIAYDISVANEAERRQCAALEEKEAVSRRLSAQAKRGQSMADLINIMLPTAVIIERLIRIARDLKQQNSPELVKTASKGSDILKGVMEQILGAVSEQVRAYWGANEGEVNSCLMVGHEIGTCPSAELQDLEKRAKFLGYGRRLGSYKAALELVAWGAKDHEVPALVLPVEDATDCHGTNHLIPGAPHAYALGQDDVIADTSKIKSYCPSGLESDTQDELYQYFATKRFKSFCSIVLREGGEPLGILNAQYNRVEICGPGDAQKDTLIGSLAHYRDALGYILRRQRILRQMTS